MLWYFYLFGDEHLFVGFHELGQCRLDFLALLGVKLLRGDDSSRDFPALGAHQPREDVCDVTDQIEAMVFCENRCKAVEGSTQSTCWQTPWASEGGGLGLP